MQTAVFENRSRPAGPLACAAPDPSESRNFLKRSALAIKSSTPDAHGTPMLRNAMPSLRSLNAASRSCSTSSAQSLTMALLPTQQKPRAWNAGSKEYRKLYLCQLQATAKLHTPLEQLRPPHRAACAFAPPSHGVNPDTARNCTRPGLLTCVVRKWKALAQLALGLLPAGLS